MEPHLDHTVQSSSSPASNDWPLGVYLLITLWLTASLAVGCSMVVVMAGINMDMTLRTVNIIITWLGMNSIMIISMTVIFIPTCMAIRWRKRWGWVMGLILTYLSLVSCFTWPLTLVVLY